MKKNTRRESPRDQVVAVVERAADPERLLVVAGRVVNVWVGKPSIHILVFMADDIMDLQQKGLWTLQLGQQCA